MSRAGLFEFPLALIEALRTRGALIEITLNYKEVDCYQSLAEATAKALSHLVSMCVYLNMLEGRWKDYSSVRNKGTSLFKH